jgi:arylsulfatase
MRPSWLPLVLLAGCAFAQEPPPPPAVAPIVLVSLDTLRADRLGCYGDRDGLTPSLDRFAAQGILFEQAYSQATTTAPSHASLFTSRYPTEQQAADRKPAITPAMKTLAEVLGAYGWDTAAFVAGGDLAPEMGIGRGFATYESAVDFASLWHTAPLALAWLDAHAGDASPWLLFVHGYDAHVPYLKPAPFGYAYADPTRQGPGQEAARTSTERIMDGWLHPDMGALFGVSGDDVRPRSPAARQKLLDVSRAAGRNLQRVNEDDLRLVRAVYDGGVAYADAQFGLLMAGLQDRGVLDRAVVVVFGDHGEQLGEDGLFQHCCGVSDGETHVPLLVRLPGGKNGGRRVSGLVELVDVMPTLVELAGAVPPAGIHGHSFAAALRGEPFTGRPVAYTEGGLGMRMLGARTAAGRLTYAGGPMASAITPELIETAALPGPSFTSTDALPPAAQAELRTGMAVWLRTLSPAPEEQATVLPDRLRASLQAHGYWEVTP